MLYYRHIIIRVFGNLKPFYIFFSDDIISKLANNIRRSQQTNHYWRELFEVLSWKQRNVHFLGFALQWRDTGRDWVSNHQPYDCLLNRWFRRRSKKTSKLRVTGLCAGNSPGTGEFPAQMASNVENVFIGWRHHGPTVCGLRNRWCCSSDRFSWTAIQSTWALAEEENIPKDFPHQEYVYGNQVKLPRTGVYGSWKHASYSRLSTSQSVPTGILLQIGYLHWIISEPVCSCRVRCCQTIVMNFAAEPRGRHTRLQMHIFPDNCIPSPFGCYWFRIRLFGSNGVVQNNRQVIPGVFMMTSSNENIYGVTAICAGNSPVTGEFLTQSQWRGALMFSLSCAWVNNGEASDFRCHCAHHNVSVMLERCTSTGCVRHSAYTERIYNVIQTQIWRANDNGTVSTYRLPYCCIMCVLIR